MKLYNLAIGDFPIDSVFRSVQVFKCRYCGALTNKTYWANCFMGGARVQCPNEEEKWHDRIVGLRHVRLFEERPKAYEEAVQKEVAEILAANPPKNDLIGSPDLTWEAEAILQEGYVMDGVAFAPSGKKRLAASAGLQEPVFPPFVEEVFAQFGEPLDESIRSLLRESICLRHEFLMMQKRMERGEQGVVEAMKGNMARTRDLNTRIEAVPGYARDRGGVGPIELLYRTYHDAYRQWRAEQHLAELGQQGTVSV